MSPGSTVFSSHRTTISLLAALILTLPRIAAAEEMTDATRLAVAAEWMSKDPTRAALVLLELENPDATAAVSRMREALRQPLALLLAGQGREGRVYVPAVALDPGGRKLASSFADGTVGILDVDGAAGRLPGKPVILRGHVGRVWHIAFSSDGTQVVTAGHDQTVRVWSTDGSGVPVVLRGHQDRVRSAVFSPDGTRVLSGSWDQTARVWNVDGSGSPVILRGHQALVESALFSRDGTQVLIKAGPDSWVWNADGSGRPTVLSHWKLRACFDPGGTRVVGAEDEPVASVMNVDGSGQPILLVQRESDVTCAAFSDDGTRVVTGYLDGTARVWNADGSGRAIVLRGHEGRLRSAHFNADGTRVVTASEDHTARVWTLGVGSGGAETSGEVLVLRGHRNSLDQATFSSDGTKVVTSSRGGIVRVWEVDRSTQVQPADGAGLQAALRSATSACLDPDFRAQELHESPTVAWQTYAECEIRFGRCPLAWELETTVVESPASFLRRLSPEEQERFQACLPPPSLEPPPAPHRRPTQ